jgi:tetratricopeptide (TPR) repeat protein
MSYINDALRKAQKDKDNRYEPFGGVIAPNPDAARRPRNQKAVFGSAAALVILVSAVLLFAVYGLKQPSSQPEGVPPPPAAAAETPAPAATAKVVRPADGPTETGRADVGRQPSVQPKGAPPPPAAAAKKRAPKSTEKAVRLPEMREADVRYQEALIAQRAGDLRRAEEIYEKVLAVDSGHVRTLNNLGVIYMGQKKREKAIAVFGRAVVLKKDYVDPYYNLACLYAQENEIGESIWYLKVAAAIDGDVMNWVKKDADMKNVAASPEFKKIMEGQKN